MDNSNLIACVTGASGMVGRRIVERLIQENYHVRVLSRKSSFPLPGVEHFKGSLADEGILKEFVTGARLLFHCAAEKTDESIMRDVNVDGTERLIDIVNGASVEYFCFISSAGVIGRTKDSLIDEETPCNPQTIYESTKWDAEKAVMKGQMNCRTVVLRPTNVIDEQLPGPVQSSLANPAISRAIGIFRGAESAHILHAKDVADAALYFADKCSDHPEIYFVSRDDDPANTFGGIQALIDREQKAKGNGKTSKNYFLPIWFVKLIRRLFLRADIPSDSCFTADKLFSTGFCYKTTIAEFVREIITKRPKELNGGDRNERLLTGGIWALFGKIAVSALNLVINALLARILTVEEMGGYFLSLSFVMVAAVFAQFGLNYAIVRVVAESMAKGRKYYAVRSILFAFKFTGGVLAFLSFLLALKGGSWIANHVLDSYIIAQVSGVLAIWVVVFALQHLLGETFRGFADIRFATIFSGILPSALAFFFTLGIWFGIGKSSLSQVILLFVVSGVISICMGGINLWRLCRKNSGQDVDQEFKPGYLLSMAWPMWITNLMLFVLAQADLWIIGIAKLEGGVALYGAAAKFAILIPTPQLIINAVIPPHVAELHSKKQKAEAEQIMRSTATIGGLIGFGMFLVLGIFGGPILGAMYGAYYKSGADVLLMLCFGQFIAVCAGSCSVALMMTGHQVLMMVITMISGIVSIGMAVVLVKPYGAEGVAFATATGLILQSLAMVIAVKVKINIWTPMYTPLRSFVAFSNKGR